MVDWLSVMMTGPWHSVHGNPGDCFPWDAVGLRRGLCIVVQEGTKHFAKRFYVTDAVGEKLVTILAAPVDHKKFPPDFMTAQFDNATLPTGEWRELLRALTEMGCTHVGVQRVDIAADGWEENVIGGGGDFIPVVQAALMGFGSYYGKAHWKTHHLRRSFNGFEFGSRAGNKFLRCYRKKREMKAKGLKPHVVEAWRAALNGADPMKDPREVGRLEVQMKGKELRRYLAGEDDAALLAELHDPRTRVGVFASATKSTFDFRTWPTDGRARSAKTMHEWDWHLCTTNPPELYQRDQRKRTISPQRIKSGLHMLFDLYQMTADDAVLQAVYRVANAAGPEFVDYVNNKQLPWSKLHENITGANTIDRRGPHNVQRIRDEIRGTAGEIGDPFTLGFLHRLRDSSWADRVDNAEKFHDAHTRPVVWEEIEPEPLPVPPPPPPPEEPEDPQLVCPF